MDDWKKGHWIVRVACRTDHSTDGDGLSLSLTLSIPKSQNIYTHIRSPLSCPCPYPFAILSTRYPSQYPYLYRNRIVSKDSMTRYYM